MANALPLLLGAAAVFMLMGKKSGSTGAPSVVVVENGDTQAGIEALYDPSSHDRVCAIISTVDGFSADQVAAVARKALVAHPRTLFYVFSGSTVDLVAQWLGEAPLGPRAGIVGASVGEDLESGGHTAAGAGVTAADAEARILTIVDMAMAAAAGAGGQGASRGRQLASIGPAVAKNTGFSRATLVGQPRQGLFRGLVSAAREQRVLR